MATKKQIEANRQNARKSTGAKTKEGKESVKRNALKHGLTSRAMLLPNENEEEFLSLKESIESELTPQGGLECVLVERIVSCAWRLRRIMQIEAGLFHLENARALWRRAEKDMEEFEETRSIYDSMNEQEVKKIITNEEEHGKAKASVEKAKRWAYSTPSILGIAYENNCDDIQKLSRYETTIERSLQRAIMELERLRIQKPEGKQCKA